jgi:hypothetical protein
LITSLWPLSTEKMTNRLINIQFQKRLTSILQKDEKTKYLTNPDVIKTLKYLRLTNSDWIKPIKPWPHK